MFQAIIIILIFVAMFVTTSCPEPIMTTSEVITVTCTVVSTLLGVWGIVYYAFRRRDKEIKQLLKSEQEFKDHKEQTSVNFMAYSKRLDKTEENINKKLDDISSTINSHSVILARLDERTKDK